MTYAESPLEVAGMDGTPRKGSAGLGELVVDPAGGLGVRDASQDESARLAGVAG